jgi:hypothetical protein
MNDINKAFDRFARKSDPAPQAVVSSVAEKQTSALNIDSDSVCPYCKKDMVPVISGGVECFLCDSDRHVAPARNKGEI